MEMMFHTAQPERGATPPLSLEETIPGDLFTPVGAFLALRSGAGGAFLLESVEGGEHVARYSIVGSDPAFLLESRANRTLVRRGGESSETGRSILEIAREFLSAGPRPAGGPSARFAGGLVGFIGYDEVRTIERLPAPPPDATGAPDSILGCFRNIVVFDHLTHTVRLVVSSPPGPGGAPEESRADLGKRLARLRAKLPGAEAPPPPGAFSHGEIALDLREFPAKVEKTLEEIRSGEIFQAVLSERAVVPFAGDPFQVYRALRMINPSPYHFYMDFGGTALLGSSPELLVRLGGGRLEHVPIAGTRRRGGSEAEDDGIAAGLLADPKERAEHVMLVDLGRNDLSRVSRPGSVRVDRFMEVERFSHVMHLVSRLSGEPLPETDAVGAFRSLFPAGTVTGAPKIRAMEIIDGLEPRRRGFYGGAAGFFDAAGGMDFCLTIRSMLAHGGSLHLQAGAGVVAHSDPGRETGEVRNKLLALFEALRLAGGMAP